MKPIPIKAVVAAAMFGALLGGCATTLDMGPGYYHYSVDTVAYRTAPAVVAPAVVAPAVVAPAVVTTAPTVVYREPTVVYREPAVTYRSTLVY